MINLSKTKLFWYLKRKRRKTNIRKGTPSQYGQDQIVYDLLGKPQSGTFVDIGANDGVSFSNSLFFEKKNWTGLCIEPHPIAYETLKSSRSCECLNACVIDSDTTVDFLVIEGSAHMLSGIASFMDQKHLERIEREIKNSGGQQRTIKIDALCPDTFLSKYSIKRIDYLSIDTEGCELAILKHFDLKEIEVKVIGVENGSRSPELFNYLNRAGYKLHSCVGCDEIYTKR
jgi:FkbM family methyltransferase